MTGIDYIERLLQRRLRLINVTAATLPEGFTGPNDVPSTPRFLLVRKGEITFAPEGRPRKLRAGAMVLIVPWVRRQWWGPAGTEVTWCHFDVEEPPADVPRESLVGRDVDIAVEAAAFGRLRELHRRGTRREVALAIDGELKSVLGRFATSLVTRSQTPATRRRTASDAAIRHATEWLAANYARVDAIQRLPEIADLSPKHFRECFRRRTGMNAQRYLLTLRMRLARFYLHESTMQVKQTAAAVGYVDPLYFSKTYRKFWGKSPSDDLAEADPKRNH